MLFFRIFLPFACGYFLSQLLRSVNAVVSADLVAELGLDAWAIGLLTSAYFLAFAGGQLPLGVALDRWGPRRTEALLLLFAAAGAAVFAAAETRDGLILGRALIGFGVSACLMASFHAFALWAPAHRLPFLNGAVMAVGAAGALTATAPVEWWVASMGWRHVFGVSALATLGASALLFFSAPDPPETVDEHLRDVVRGVGRVFRSKVFWSIAPFSVAHQGAYLAIQSLWAGPWLRDVALLSRPEVASQLLTLALGMGIGFFGLGYAAEKLSRGGVSLVVLWGLAALVFQSSQALITLEWVQASRLLWFVFGVSGASGMLSYVVLTRRFPIGMAGRVNTGINVLVFSGAFAMQAGIGAIIEVFAEPGQPFSPGGYRVAFGSVLALQCLGLVWMIATSSWRTRISTEAPTGPSPAK